MALDFFGDLLDPVDGVVDAIIGKIEDALDNALGGVEASIESIVDKATAPIDAALDGVGGLISQFETRVLDAVDAVIDRVDEPLEFITDKVTAVPDIILDGVEDIVGVVTDKVTDLLDIGIGAIENTVGTLFTRVGELASFALDSLTAALDNVKEAFATGAEVVAEGAQKALTSLFPGFLDFVAPDMAERLEAIVNEFESTPGIPDGIKAITAPGALPVAGAGALVLVLGIYPAVAALVNAGLSPYMELVTQGVMAKARPTLLPAGDAIRAQRRGLMDPDKAIDQMAKAGWSAQNIAVLRSLDQTQLNVQESIGMWLRQLWFELLCV
ncbi:hypothetical protein LCGC14_2901260 [marine sediment metagenome]|uniref:Uncharacterized protein n=1 Tax=marine sediment metagenome TaxID=412755 RepID=A0A0F9A276_9ZZZZ